MISSHDDERNLSLAAAFCIDHVKKRVAVSVTEGPPAELQTRDAREPGGFAHVKQSHAVPRIVHLTMHLPRPNSYTPSQFCGGASSESGVLFWPPAGGTMRRRLTGRHPLRRAPSGCIQRSAAPAFTDSRPRRFSTQISTQRGSAAKFEMPYILVTAANWCSQPGVSPAFQSGNPISNDNVRIFL